jgi:hypothetical protein
MSRKGHLYRIYHPSVFQGKNKRSNYFEGWYFKLVDPEGRHIWSVIPGVSHSSDSHSFIQLIHANSGQTHYVRFSLDEFSYEEEKFSIQIGPNQFSENHLFLDLKAENLRMQGEISFHNNQRFPVSLFSPGIMGWYALVPFMECYHGVVSMQHQLSGNLKINESTITYKGGKGYIEKDWGRSMPSDWIWMQSNHFDQDGEASFMLSVARIPWLRGYFPGFLSFLLVDKTLYRFATYNNSKVSSLRETEDRVEVVLSNKKHTLEVGALKQEGGLLKAPKLGSMERHIKESILSSLDLVLKNREGQLIYAGRGNFAGLEIVGNMEQYYKNID